jgi:hypothetical protein
VALLLLLLLPEEEEDGFEDLEGFLSSPCAMLGEGCWSGWNEFRVTEPRKVRLVGDSACKILVEAVVDSMRERSE